MGRSCWSDVIKNARTIGRLIWFHVPPYLSIKTTEEIRAGKFQRSPQELSKVMAEKRMALDLVEGYASNELFSLNFTLLFQVRSFSEASYSRSDHTQSFMMI